LSHGGIGRYLERIDAEVSDQLLAEVCPHIRKAIMTLIGTAIISDWNAEAPDGIADNTL
jgi:hypothetical protein